MKTLCTTMLICSFALASPATLASPAIGRLAELGDERAREVLDDVQRLSGLREYDRAMSLFELVKEHNEEAIESIDGLKMAVVKAVAASREEHLAHSRWLLAQFPDPELATDAERAVKGYVLVPWADDADLIAAAVERCRFAVEQATDAGEAGYLPWFHGSYGMALYRAGEFEAAAESLAKSKDDESPFISSLTLAYHAMAEHQNGNAEAARESLEAARALVNAFPEPGSEHYQEEWTDILMSTMALEEAEELLGG